ncbi:hypothetical protein MUK42_05448 [Musa troglodytarum]|uniref:Uncharacterized protein n=1 Tax=Musa troglodytarum TaxID=320322 RepID=A0A9E7JKS1_9LILI|nr:hypothetical protein MUK42_05448 [Musa troglodytarum]
MAICSLPSSPVGSFTYAFALSPFLGRRPPSRSPPRRSSPWAVASVCQSWFLDDLKALQKNSGAAVSNELVKDGRHLTDVAWKATMDLVVGDDDDGDSRVVEVVEQMRGKTIIVQEYGVELLIEERFLEVIESKVEVRKRWAMSKNRPTKRLLLASSSWSLRQEMVWEMRPQKRYGVDMEEAAPIKRSSSIGRYPTILTSLRSTLTMTLIKVSSSVVVQKTL